MNAKLVAGSLVIGGAIVFLVISAIQGAAQYSHTVKSLLDGQAALAGRDMNLRVAGFVIGDSIQHDSKTLALSFDIVDSHEELASPQRVLHVIADGHVRPDLLRHEAKATVTGKLGAEGAFYVAPGNDSLLLNCPTRYEQAVSTLTPAGLFTTTLVSP